MSDYGTSQDNGQFPMGPHFSLYHAYPRKPTISLLMMHVQKKYIYFPLEILKTDINFIDVKLVPN